MMIVWEDRQFVSMSRLHRVTFGSQAEANPLILDYIGSLLVLPTNIKLEYILLDVSKPLAYYIAA
jgi:hypothetical protein